MIAALFASVSAIRLSKEGDWLPRPCEMGADIDAKVNNCVKTPKYN